MVKEYNWDYLLRCLESNNINDFNNKINKDVYVFGAGLAGNKVKKAIEGMANVHAFIDNDEKKVNTCIDGIKVMGFQEREIKDMQIIIASQWYKEIIRQLNDEDFYNYIVYPFELFEWDNCKIIEEFKVLENAEKYKNVYDNLEDDLSKEVYIRMLAYRATGDRELIKISNYDQYIHPSIEKNKVNTVIDAGAYNGDTIKIFFSQFSNLNHLYAFEPTKDKLIQIKEMINKEKRNFGEITLLDKCLWSTCTNLKFQTFDAAMTNKVSDEGEITISAISLDEFANGLNSNQKINFIKMDIEGSEVEALKGGEQLIKKDKPILAISIYHDITHFWKVFDVIQQFDLGYKYFVGHHKDVLFDTVLYALPSNN
ncbi:FkbM family methyltransferase [Calidifontibacillus oryziterrae]|uniref:FkbM family methyltransferase n=1 Tax=Calidifontibacillus oryziterrae TaxID=1191699 RepID=UPI0002DA0FDE|nr:FkbM family methyltransferase [Calidifontibacillus oryziterrae]